MSTRIPAEYADTSSWSYHVDTTYYGELARRSDLLREDWPEAAPDETIRAQSFLTREARQIDEGRFNDWLELFTDDCLYWVPVTPGGGDPTTEVSHAFDDRRRLTDRVYWLRTGLAFSRDPRVPDPTRHRQCRDHGRPHERRAPGPLERRGARIPRRSHQDLPGLVRPRPA